MTTSDRQEIKMLEREVARLKRDVSLLAATKEKLERTQQSLISEKRFSDSVIACLPGLFFMIDENGRYVRWNKNLETTLGYSSDDMQHRDACEIVPPEDKEKIRNATERGFRQGSFALEYSNISIDGRRIPYYGQGVSTEIDGRRYLIGVEINLSDLKEAERALKESEEHLRSLMEAAVNFAVYRIAFIDGDPGKTTVVFVSPSIKTILGVDEPENLSKWFENIHPDDKQKITDSHFSLPRRMRVDEIMRVFSRETGQWRWTQFISTSVMDENGRLKYSNGVIFDVNDRVEITEKLKAREEELKVKTNRLAELNTALRVIIEQREQEIEDIRMNLINRLHRLIKPYLHELEETVLSEEQKTYLTIIQSNLRRISFPQVREVIAWQNTLTPTELKVADFIRNGKTTKEIATLLRVSDNAVAFHRKSIRKKIGIVGKKVNLITYFQSTDGE